VDDPVSVALKIGTPFMWSFVEFTPTRIGAQLRKWRKGLSFVFLELGTGIGHGP
jgi:hypothetical protein